MSELLLNPKQQQFSVPPSHCFKEKSKNAYPCQEKFQSYNTVNSEIFGGFIFTELGVYAKFRENKILAKSRCRLLI